jgi:hypothetical protein
MVARARASVIAPMPGALLGVVLAHLAGVGEVASRSPGATREISCSGRTHPHVDVERLGDQGLHMVRDADGGGSPNDLVQQPP